MMVCALSTEQVRQLQLRRMLAAACSAAATHAPEEEGMGFLEKLLYWCGCDVDTPH
jgi:hypothetical protein